MMANGYEYGLNEDVAGGDRGGRVFAQGRRRPAAGDCIGMCPGYPCMYECVLSIPWGTIDSRSSCVSRDVFGLMMTMISEATIPASGQASRCGAGRSTEMEGGALAMNALVGQ